MRTITLNQLTENPDMVAEICDILDEGGMVCVPCSGAYRILVDLENGDAVTRMLQTKRRVKKAPSLIFVQDESMVERVAADFSPEAQRLSRRFWPGPLTILFDTHPSMPRKISKQLADKRGRVGVRVPHDALARQIVRRLGRPILVSSANRQRKPGEGSPAQVRKNFTNNIDLFVDAGDIRKDASSTVIDVAGDSYTLIREGAISSEMLESAMD